MSEEKNVEEVEVKEVPEEVTDNVQDEPQVAESPDVQDKLDKARAEVEEKKEPTKKIGIDDGGKGKDMVDPGKSEYPPVNMKVPKMYKPQFSPAITVTELAGLLDIIISIQGEEAVRKLSLYPNISFKEVPTQAIPMQTKK